MRLEILRNNRNFEQFGQKSWSDALASLMQIVSMNGQKQKYSK